MDGPSALELYVHSPAFDEACKHARVPESNDSNSDYYASYHSNLLENDSFEASPGSPYDVSKLEAYLYYSGIRGFRRRGPKLIFRTSKDIYTPPLPEHDTRFMQLLPVYEHHKLGKDDLWVTIRSKVCDLKVQQSVY